MQKNQLIARTKKWMSSFLIFFIFAIQTIQIPLLVPKVSAAGSEAPNLVSILVSESTYSGELASKIKRYAGDIQKALPNTRAVIVEVPDMIAPQTIAATNEKLYYEGDGKGNGRLVGTVLVGKLPIPVVHKGSKAFMSIYPYTDFDDKAFIFDTSKGYYDWNPSVGEKDAPEIWHGIIQPNTGDSGQDTQKLLAFFDKTHDFYTSAGVFANSSTEPSVFYFDIVHDQAASQPEAWNAYSLYLEYLEEIAYNRYSKHLAKTLYNRFQSFQDPAKAVNEGELQAIGVNLPTGVSEMSFDSSPDIQTRTAIEKTVKQFFQVLNEKHIGETLKFIYNTGRYGTGDGVRADYAPVLVSKRDEFMKRYLKDANTAIEDAIDSLVKNGLARDVLIPTKLETATTGVGNDANGQPIDPPDNPRAPIYKNYYYGLNAENIQSAKDCSIVRGSSLMVEANRGYNVQNVQSDVDLLSKNAALCFSGEKAKTEDFWGGNSPLNLDIQNSVSSADLDALNKSIEDGTQMDFFKDLESNPSSAASISDLLAGSKLKLLNNRYRNFVLPAFDLVGQNEISTGGVLSQASPLDCRSENMIADPFVKQTGDEGGGSGAGGSRFMYYHPDSTRGTAFACVMRDSNGNFGHKTLDENATEILEKIVTNTLTPDPSNPQSQCTKYTVTVEGGFTKSYGGFCIEGAGDSQTTVGFTQDYSYKKVPSWIEHKSPNNEEYAGALKGFSTPSLAHDKDRFIDFLLPSGEYAKIQYPNFFRLTFASGNITSDQIKQRIKEVLDAKSTEINELIRVSNPAYLNAKQKALYDILKRGDYPSDLASLIEKVGLTDLLDREVAAPEGQVDLFGLLSSNQTLLDTLIDTLYWYNQGNATSKYAFTLENYLDRDGNRGYPLAGHKSDYEIAYIGGPGDAANMYVKLDPAAKSGPPAGVSAVQADYASFLNVLNASNISGYSPEDGKFQCGPPEGVPIWKWLPAVFCWLKTILPPTVVSGSCKAPAGVSKKPFIDFFTKRDSNNNGKPDIEEDVNKNGILDGLEMVKNGEVVLKANKPQLKFNDAVTLTATLRAEDKILAHDTESIVQFDIKRVTLKAAQGSGASDIVVYARGATGDMGKIETLEKYIGFKPLGVPVGEGEAMYTLTSKTSEVNVTLEAFVAPKDRNGVEAFKKVSNEIVLEVRNESLSVLTKGEKSGNSNKATAFEVNSIDALVFDLQVTNGNAVTGESSGRALAAQDFPVEVQLFDDVTNTSLTPVTKITSGNYKLTGDKLTRAGVYRVEFVDATGRFGSSTVTLLPGRATSLDVAATSSVYVKGQKNLILVRAIDAQGNTVTGKTTQFNAEISGGGFFVENKQTTLQKSSVEGYVSLEISTNDGAQNQTIKITHPTGDGQQIAAQIQVQSVDDAKVIAKLGDGGNTIVAGSTAQPFELMVTRPDGSVINGFNGIASLDFPKNSGIFSSQFVEIKNGKSSPVTFAPGTLAIADGKIDVSIPGIKNIEGGSISVVPALPMRVETSLRDATLEAKNGNTTEIVAKLFDRFGNLAYNHASGMTATFSVPDISKKYAQVSATAATFTQGVARAQVAVTDTPGTAYYIAEVQPGLESNAFSITDESGATLTVKGFSKATGIVETYYLWNKSKIDKTNYNALSTTLLGADYGNVTVKNYLGGEILFNTDSRSLAVTSLLNSPIKRKSVMTITPGGKLTLSESTVSEVVAGTAKGRTSFDLYDPFRKESIGRLYLNLDDATPLFACGTSAEDSLDGCDIQGSKSYILLKGIGDGVSIGTKGSSLVMSMEGVPVFEIFKNGTIQKNPLISVEAEGLEVKNFLSLTLKSNGVIIGRVGIKLDSTKIGVAGADTIDQALAANGGSFVYETSSPRFTVSETYLGNTSYGAKGIEVLEPVDSLDGIDRELLGSSSKVGLEEYTTKQGIGFGDGNNTLLEFASQATIGEASRGSATYSQIVLGDPVARLPELATGQSYDRTLGKRLTEGFSGAIESYATLDYNGDNKQDIVVFYENGRVELLQNFNGTYRSLGYLLYVVDAGPERKVAGDFSGDGYGDIIMTDNKGQLIVIDNRKGKYARIPTKILAEDGSVSKIAGNIMQLEAFDMDKDGKLDLVYSDDAGELVILYGAQDSNGLYFQKKLLDGDIGLKLSNASSTTEGAIRWTGIPEITPPTQSEFQAESLEGEDSLSETEYRRFLDSKVYYLETTQKTVTGAIALANRIAAGSGDDPANPGSVNSELALEIGSGIRDITSLSNNGADGLTEMQTETVTETRTFLRSEFADGKSIGIDKTYIDKNGGSLQAGDRVQVAIRITNSGATDLSGVEYLDSFDTTVFSVPDVTEYSILSDAGSLSGSLNSLTESDFTFHFKGMSIGAGRSAIIQYEVTANALKYGTFKVGILETDDQYGDVSMNANSLCGDEELLWRSTAQRSYEKTLKKIELSGNAGNALKGKFTDFNENGEPDYLDLISGVGGDTDMASSLWDPTTHGILVFRELPNTEGVLDGQNFEYGRIVGDASKGYVQSSGVSTKTDIPVLATPGATNLILSNNGMKVGDTSDLSGSACGANGTISSDLQAQGVELEYKSNEMNSIKSVFKIRATGKSNAVNAAGETTSSEACVISINAVSDPIFEENTTKGIGWKILTKRSFSHFALAGTQANIVDKSSGFPDRYEPKGTSYIRFTQNGFSTGMDLSGLSNDNVDKINSTIDTIIQGLGCGFGGGACLSLPMNWAPLAPGSAPVILGTPIGPLTPDTGLPVFSALNFKRVGKYCVPMPYPPAVGGPGCVGSSAGGWLGTWSPANTFRFFITPTITGAVGIAACYGGPAKATGNIPPKGVSPVVPGGNCIVAATPLAGCKDDGSDGNIDDLGTSDGNGTLNAASCKNGKASDTITPVEQRKIADYVKRRESLGSSDSSFVGDIIRNMSGRSGMKIPSRPLLSIGGRGASGGSQFDISIDPSAITSFKKGSIVKISQKRVSAFPDFIMDWVNRQLEEVANKLTSLPTLYIIKPDFRGALDTEWTGFSDKLASAYAGGNQNGAPVFGNEVAGRQISGIKAAYSFMSRIPLIRFEKRVITVAYPSIGEEDLDKIKNTYESTLAQWEKEISTKKTAYAKLGTQEGIDASVAVRAEGLVGSIRSNIETIENYKKYPEKLAKYLTWKERYAKQLLCNVLAIQALLDGFITKNALRFKAWVEFGELIKNILKGWQIIPQLFYQNDAECGVCRNERYDAKHFKFKLIKAIIPPLPIIKFPKWPDIILDLHNVRLGLRIPMPEFVFQPTPLVLPTLPKLFLPNTPGLGINLPTIPQLPQLPPLPDLPNIPSLPLIKLPELPPPPTVPKLFGAIKFTLNILKIVAKVMCIMRTNPFVPEWRAGDQIAQITERQGKLGIDFLNIEFPQMNFAFIDAIKVTTYVNFEFRLDFIMEMAKAATEPLNSFNSNLSNIMSAPALLSPGNVNLRGTIPKNTDINIGPTGMGDSTTRNIVAQNSTSPLRFETSTVDVNSPEEVSKYASFLAKGFVTLINQGQHYANEFASYEDVRENLAYEVANTIAAPGSPEAKILAEMSDGLKKRFDSEVEAFASELRAENARKFKRATDYIESEERETREILAQLERAISGEISLDEALGGKVQKAGDARLISANSGLSTESELPDFTEFDESARAAYGQMIASAVPSQVSDVSSNRIAIRDESVASAAESLLIKTQTISASVTSNQLELATDTGLSNSDQGENLAEYQYRGIYAKDNGKQIRLFDYTNDLDGKERAITIDRLGNGKIEYVYKSGEILYLKTQLGNPAQTISDSISEYSLEDIIGQELDQTAPNHFAERFSSAGEINIGFKPGRAEDIAYRLTFFDYIDRYSRLSGGEVLSSIEPKTRSVAVDLMPEFKTENQNADTGFAALVSRKPFGNYTAGVGEVQYNGPTYRKLGQGSKIRIGTGKSIYTGSDDAIIRFVEADAQAQPGKNSGQYTMNEMTQLDFLLSMDIEVISGEILLPESNPDIASITLNIQEIRGYPVLLGTRMETENAAVKMGITYYNGANSLLSGPFGYQTYSLGSRSTSYEVSIRHENGWYYSELKPITPDEYTKANITLLSPQLEADKESPLMNVSKSFRAPVYQERKVNLVDLVTDNGGISDMFVDVDLAVDSDGDGKKDNDRDSDLPNSPIKKGSFLQEFVITPQTTLFEKNVKLWAYDQRGNVTSKETPFQIYSPIPTIVSASGSTLYGQLDEAMTSEPVDILRYRNGAFNRIGDTLSTISTGAFSGSFSQEQGIRLTTTQSGTIASINEKTGVIVLSGSTLSTEVIPATEQYPMQIFVKNGQDLLYTQAISLGTLATIESINGETDPKRQQGIGPRVLLKEGYSLIASSPSAPTLPSGAYIVDSARKPVFAIGKDGNIYSLLGGRLVYKVQSGMFGIGLYDRSNIEIGTVWYKMNAEFIIK